MWINMNTGGGGETEKWPKYNNVVSVNDLWTCKKINQISIKFLLALRIYHVTTDIFSICFFWVWLPIDCRLCIMIETFLGM